MIRAKKMKLAKILKTISKDMEDDAMFFDCLPFTGGNVAEYFGKQGAAISAIANIVDEILEVD